MLFSASFHTEYTQAAAFSKKLSWFSDLLDLEARVVINQVVLPGRLAEQRVRDRGSKPQSMRVDMALLIGP